MKKYITTIFTTVIVTTILLSCKKDSTPKDYTASIKDKTWWGQFTYFGQTAEYYSLHFSADNDFRWSELSGDINGTWAVTGKKLTITFSNGVKINADISDDNKLGNIVATSNGFIVNSGELFADSNLRLDYTIWKGSINILGVTSPLLLTFTPDSKFEMKIDNSISGPHVYTRPSSGLFIRTNFGLGKPFFGVITSASEMKGSAFSAAVPWRATKQ